VNFAPFTASADERAFDLSKPVYLTLRGKKTKQSGYARLNPDGKVERLVLADTGYSALARADSAQVFAFARQRYDTPPVLRVGSDIANAKTVITTNAQAKDYAWSKVEMFDFKSTIGVPLQALLYYPANYDPSKKYPMIVYTYELLTQGLTTTSRRARTTTTTPRSSRRTATSCSCPTSSSVRASPASALSIQWKRPCVTCSRAAWSIRPASATSVTRRAATRPPSSAHTASCSRPRSPDLASPT
jgi:hypothetical protein